MMGMDIFSQILDIKGFRVIHIETRDTELHLSLESESKSGVCPRCGQKSTQVRQWYQRVVRDLPISGKRCYVHVEKRYFDCPNCHETFAEELDFVEPKRDYTRRYEDAIFQQVRATTAKHVAECEGLTDPVVTRIFLRQAQQRIPADPFTGVVRLGIDEIAERKGRNSYDLVFYNLETGKPIDVLENRTQAELLSYFAHLSEEMTCDLEEVCIDMWRPYALAIAEQLPHVKVVTDRFHVMKVVNHDLNTLKNTLKPELPDDAKACHYPLLKNEADLTEQQQEILERVYEASPQLKEAHQLKEAFRAIFDTAYTVEQGTQALQRWIDKAERVHLFSEAVKTIKNWFHSIVHYFLHRTTNGPAEGINNKIKVIKRMAYGFRNFAHFRLRILAAFL
jgi:transposase